SRDWSSDVCSSDLPAASALSTMCFISAGDSMPPSISNLGMGFLIRCLLIFGIFLLLQIYNYHIPIPLRSVCTNPKNCRTRNRWPLRDCLAPPGYRNTPIFPLRDVPHPVFEAVAPAFRPVRFYAR